MPLPVEEREFLERIKPPAHEKVRARANEFIGLAGLSVGDFSEAIRNEYGRGSRTALLWWLRGDYGRNWSNDCSTRFMDARVWDYIERNWPKPEAVVTPDDILETQAAAKLREVFEDALESGANALVYGPPSSEKSQVLQFLVGRRRAAGHEDSYYLLCGTMVSSPLAFLRALGRAIGVNVPRAHLCDQYREAIVRSVAARPQLPVVVLDEAQDLQLKTLNVIRDLHELTRRRGRRGMAFILAGSHNLFRDFMHPVRRPRLEQLLSRIPHRIQLGGMQRAEVLQLASRAFGNGRPAKFTAEQERRLLDRCTVEDPYATDANGEPLRDGKGRVVVRTYFSARRLLEYIRQQKRARVSKVLAEEVA